MKLSLLIGLLALSFISFADDAERRLETNINDRMKNEIPNDQIKPKGISDSAITREIKDSLKSSKISNYAKNIRVVSAHGHVSLKGRIVSSEEESIILQKVRSVAGVTMVLNEMQISPDQK